MSQSRAARIINSYKFIDKKICGWLFINLLMFYWTLEISRLKNLETKICS